MTTFFILLAINVFAFLLMGYDKKLAQTNQRRISEKALLTSAILGGSVGSGIGMLYFRHKTSKNSYLVKFWSIVIIQIIVLYFGLGYVNL
ncbi:DUF1294 domain-containing protein [Flavobacterium antarcticum]|uniref:DUF1294 domain-containing protein n=1 Tax=Flavobacterium antarcticum TaxID=271155 RepID=UPI0003B76C62|nr:DUF1294 domain-containing protein [Flavobacterium antarcticum]